jgi:hypothetical protein
MVRPLETCEKCGAKLPILDLTVDIRKEIKTALGLGRLNAVKALRESCGLNLGDAKSIAFHLSEDGTCHR